MDTEVMTQHATGRTALLVTGVAGFIGYHVANALLTRGDRVIGLDNLNSYYDVRLKLDRLERLQLHAGFTFVEADLSDRQSIERLFAENAFERVINLAAQAGVRYSLKEPHAYINSNVTGFLNVLEGCRRAQVKHLVFASSSSVYGANTRQPYSTHDHADHPLSLYAATKRTNELMAHAYAHLFGIPCTGLRFFTVYGPWGRPDMAYFSFTKAILEGRPIDVFNAGHHKRDFTYIDDIVDGVLHVLECPPRGDAHWTGEEPDPASSVAPYRLYNIGNHTPVELMYFIETLESALGRTAHKNLLPLQAGDVPETFADVDDLAHDVGFHPSTSIEDGIAKFVTWYREYYNS